MTDTKTKYSHVEKFTLGIMYVTQIFRYYISLCKTTVVSYCNPMTYILSRQLLGGKYSKWIVILQDFDLEVVKSKSKKYLAFMKWICDLPSPNLEPTTNDLIPDEMLFLINSTNPWYGYIIIYL